MDHVKKEMNDIIKQLDIIDNTMEFKTYNEYVNYRKPLNDRYEKLDRKLRQSIDYTLSDLPSYGDVMDLTEFIKCVKCGGFIDYDGSGNYVKDGKMTNITIYPSDVKHKSIRKEFDKIIWFNR